MNYGIITKAITVFDACISDKVEIPKADATKKYVEIVSKLIHAELSGKSDGIDQYILDSFHAFVQNKEKIETYVADVMKCVDDGKMQKNILITPEVSEWQPDSTEFVGRNETDDSNLLNPILFKLCKNVKSIKMVMNNYFKHGQIYTFSPYALLSIIQGTSIESA